MWCQLLCPFHAAATLLCLRRGDGANSTQPGSLVLATLPGPPLTRGGLAPGRAAVAPSVLVCWRRLGDTALQLGPMGAFTARAGAGLRGKTRGAERGTGTHLRAPFSPKGALRSSCQRAGGYLMLLLGHLYYGLILPACKVTSVLVAITNIQLVARCLKRYQKRRWSKEPGPPAGTLGDEASYADCAICLGTFEQGEALKILSCSHAYHGACIDRWHCAQPRGKTCPLCLRRVTTVALIPLRCAPRLCEEEEGRHEGEQE